MNINFIEETKITDDIQKKHLASLIISPALNSNCHGVSLEPIGQKEKKCLIITCVWKDIK